ncbi:aryl-alcohol dehydrogenase-like predicted oxidoreductase [Cricetibacter osteomyelitidis]|uniref:Aryl-alcohol dehydrogenase-like predicted oxidoreductase n=1 Tax=Cricetibacter osteomyelitidis TaxID=1521931 RepID=A0A4R2SSI0_9PAST|nr:aldo/keto reductase [Cricetibacter osteomyelitidis]TCP93259.1 aryl-alcohol dehydrogenase-like predicted oxidoreductase [Cricetibacter osteomyelitidis]
MQYIQLGNSDLNISCICLGCMSFGDASRWQHNWILDEAQSRQIIKHAIEKGINFFDTAIAYADGSSEQFVGRAVRDFMPRDQAVIATKFLPKPAENTLSGQDYIEQCLNQSLQNLGTDYVDLYIYHMWDYHTPMADIMQGLNNVVQAGKARYIGIANCYAWQLAEINALAEREGWAKFVSVQNHYNLIYREDEREMNDYCNTHGIALTPYSALAAGRLSRQPSETSTRLESDQIAKLKYDKTAEQDGKIIARVAELAEKYGVSMTQISLAWLLGKVASPVVGATKFHHIDGAVNALNITLSDEDTAYLQECYVPHELSGVMALNKPNTNVRFDKPLIK